MLSKDQLRDATVGSFIQAPLVSIGSGTTLRGAVRAMQVRQVPAIAVLDAGVITGLLSEHDVFEAIADGADPDAALVGAWMTTRFPTARAGDRLLDVAVVMLEADVRDVPVLGEHSERLGFVHLDDLEAAVLRAELQPVTRLPYMAPD